MEKQKIHWIGIDVAKKTFDAAIALEGQHYPQCPLSALPAKTFKRTEEGAKQFHAWVYAEIKEMDPRQPFTVFVTMEATGKYSEELALWLEKLNEGPMSAIVNPKLTSAFINSLGIRNKTDKLDARGLAIYGLERSPALYDSQDPSRERLRRLSRDRDTYIGMRVALQNKQSETLKDPLTDQMASTVIALLTQCIETIDQSMEETINEDETLKEDSDLLLSIPGVGEVTARVVLSEMGDLRRFIKPRQATAYAGLSPRVFNSGTSVRGKQRMSKFGNGRVRKALYMAALSAVRYSPVMRERYERMIAEGKSKMCALGAAMRHLLVLMRAVVVNKTPFNANYKSQKHEGGTARGCI